MTTPSVAPVGSDSAPVLVDVDSAAAVAVITLNRPAKRNALDADQCRRIREAVEGAVAGGARALVLTGAGPAFCAGADLGGGVYAKGFFEQLVAMLQAVENAPVPVIAAINGPAVGAGCQLAIACDLRVVAEAGFFKVPVVELGLAVDSWTVRKLAALIGGSAARAVLLAAEKVDREAAERLGLANRRGDLDEARAWAETLAGHAPLTVAHLKLLFAADGSRTPATAAQDAAGLRCWSSDDAKEARLARQEKRAPVFRGR